MFRKTLLLAITCISSVLLLTIVSHAKQLSGAEIRGTLTKNTLVLGKRSYYATSSGRFCRRTSNNKVIWTNWRVRKNIYYDTGEHCSGQGCLVHKVGSRIKFIKLSNKGSRSFRLKKGNHAKCP